MFQVSREGAIDIVSGKEPLNEEYADALERILKPCLSGGQPKMVFNLQEVPLIDSRGLEALLDAHEMALQRGGQFLLAAPNALCQDILIATGLDRKMQVFDDLISAVGSFTI
tara:strand:- start:55465 stop:55800 length:336 start_codon:yes stop_codon:yes gene_type:complete